ncbi:hypothetical protein [Nocardia sp. NPDC060249]|uniref:hypothetical protein n=1 Tax=Nocardia sp. NPDC060249 TaxID=3347082 RepID=UPI003648B8B1
MPTTAIHVLNGPAYDHRYQHTPTSPDMAAQQRRCRGGVAMLSTANCEVYSAQQ